MTITPSCLAVTIIQGATLDEAWERKFYPYAVEWSCGQLVKKGSGEPAPNSDATPEDYTGCTAEAQLRHPDTGAVLTTLSTANGGIVLDGAFLRLAMAYADTAALAYGETAPAWNTCKAHVEVTRPDGTRERQYEVTFTLNPEATV
ncbi:hypothetical protein ASF19_20160 [Acidovorax sp. Leaf84]|uniref:hypothetical protein n=1 Tax=Acidovorax sp. Leaf84 TaxID=1736240 RepID=UPI0006F8C1D8|nr:hypothetical protein [Acidovorax sp. Leaf84]KQO38091.1 hypothetical protein ASF19_20160 [Acidovorax sp. Leaf84]